MKRMVICLGFLLAGCLPGLVGCSPAGNSSVEETPAEELEAIEKEHAPEIPPP